MVLVVRGLHPTRALARSALAHEIVGFPNGRGGGMKKAILIISALDFWSMGEGRGGPALWRTIKGYSDRNWEIFFITGNRAQSNPPDLPSNAHVIRFDAPWLKHLFRIRKIGFFARTLWWIWFQVVTFFKALRIHRQHDIDVVYAYEICAVPICKLLSKVWNVPLVSRFQGTKLTPWIGRMFWQIRQWQHLVGLTIPADLIIMTNDGTKGNEVLKKLDVNMNKVKFWMNGVPKPPHSFGENDGRTLKRELGINEEHKVLLVVNRLVKWKRVDRAIKAMPRVIEEIPGALLLIVGDGKERRNLKQLAKTLKVNEHIKFIGSVPHKEVWKYYLLTDVFLSVNELSNVGNPLLEAMRCGCCIITINNGDTKQVIKDEETGILLDPQRIAELPNQVINLLRDESLRSTLGRNAQIFADNNFWTWDERIQEETQTVEKLCEKNFWRSKESTRV